MAACHAHALLFFALLPVVRERTRLADYALLSTELPLSVVWVSSLGLLFAVAGAVVLLGNFPLAVCLFMDARALRNGDFEWKPNPYAYGILGLSGYLATSNLGLSSTKVEVFGFTFDWGIEIRQFAIFLPVIACLFYLFQRYRYVGFR